MCSVLESERGDLAKFMKHSDRVQQKFYDLSQGGIRDSRMSNLVSKLVEGESITEDDLRKEKQCKSMEMKNVLFVTANSLG